jgi:subtilisin-like proprotein convertase family protein
MTPEDIIRLAREAHRRVVTDDYPGHTGQLDAWTLALLERFAALVAAAEREACAKVCDDISEEYCQREGKRLPSLRTDAESGAGDCAEAIRARSKE